MRMEACRNQGKIAEILRKGQDIQYSHRESIVVTRSVRRGANTMDFILLSHTPDEANPHTCKSSMFTAF